MSSSNNKINKDEGAQRGRSNANESEGNSLEGTEGHASVEGNNDHRAALAPTSSLNPRSQAGNGDWKRGEKALQLNDDLDANSARPVVVPVQPGVVHVVPDGGFADIESGGSATDLTTAESSNEDPLGGGGDVMAQAELVNYQLVASATLDRTDELHERVKMLEKKDLRRGQIGPYLTSKRGILCAFTLFLAVAGATVGIAIFLVGKKSQPTEAPSQVPTSQPSSNPTLAPSFFPSASPSQNPTPLPTVDVEELWTALVQSRSPATTFDNETSPEYLALEWMVGDPLTKSLFNDTDRVLQRFALALFWFATGAYLGGSWLEPTKECGWGGTALRCNVNDTLVGIYMDSLGLSGTIPKEIGLLSAMTDLTFADNRFEGTLPSEIGQLTAMIKMDLSFLDLEGTIPSEIGLLTALDTILLGETLVTGTLPTEIGMLSAVELFAFHDNDINGTLPSEIGMMTSAIILDFAGNALTGTVPSEVATLTNLENFQISGNSMTGTMPSSLCSDDRDLSIDCGGTIECTCCVGPWPGFAPCGEAPDVFGG